MLFNKKPIQNTDTPQSRNTYTKDIEQKRDYFSIMNDNLKALKEGLNY